jgi:hypothetical protein
MADADARQFVPADQPVEHATSTGKIIGHFMDLGDRAAFLTSEVVWETALQPTDGARVQFQPSTHDGRFDSGRLRTGPRQGTPRSPGVRVS